MKRWAVLLLTFALTGCGVELLTTTAIEGKLQAQSAQNAVKQLNYAKNSTNEINIRQAIEAYRVDKGVFPPSLEALAPGYLPKVPTKPDGSPYWYDPTTGNLTNDPAVAARVGDEQNIALIRAAIDRYGRATGYFPKSLYDLIPTYLEAVPRTASGQEFVYNPRTGAVYNSAQTHQLIQPQQPVQQSRGPAAGGAGPMGEVMTGIAMQNQLNSMSNSGANAAQSRGRQQLEGSIAENQRQQMKTLDKLGF